MIQRLNLLATVDRSLLVVGGVLLLVFVSVSLYRAVVSRRALREFDKNQSQMLHARSESTTWEELPGADAADFGLWSEKRIQAYHDSLAAKKDLPIAVLRLEKLHVRVPVFEGTDELVLNRGVGWIAGSAKPGEAGNIGIAGHRDGFFRGLKDISVGDLVELSTPGKKSLYAVDQIEIVTPNDVGVLLPRGVPSLTLVTCYPFYYIGDAPRRFIVHAALKQQAGASSLRLVPNHREPKHFDDKEKGQ